MNNTVNESNLEFLAALVDTLTSPEGALKTMAKEIFLQKLKKLFI